MLRLSSPSILCFIRCATTRNKLHNIALQQQQQPLRIICQMNINISNTIVLDFYIL